MRKKIIENSLSVTKIKDYVSLVIYLQASYNLIEVREDTRVLKQQRLELKPIPRGPGL